MSEITSEVKNKKIFVVCTDNIEGLDFKKPINQKMLKDFFPERMDQYDKKLVNSISAEQVFKEIK